MTRSLALLRHAKAATPLGVPDIDRPLAPRGRRDATTAGEHLRGLGLTIDRVACSPSLRTRQTLEGLGISAPVDIDRRIYGNDTDSLLAVIGEQPEDAGSLLLIGHNPSMYELCVLLSGTRPERFPTSALAVIETEAPWAGISLVGAPGGSEGRLVDFWTPKD